MSQEALNPFTHTDYTQKPEKPRPRQGGEREDGSVKSRAEDEVAMTPSQLREFVKQEERKRSMEAMAPDIASVLQGDFPVSSALRKLFEGEHAERVSQENAKHEDGDPVPMSAIALFAHRLEQESSEVELEEIHTEEGVKESIALIEKMLQVPESKYGAQKEFNKLAKELATLCYNEEATKEYDKER